MKKKHWEDSLTADPGEEDPIFEDSKNTLDNPINE